MHLGIGGKLGAKGDLGLPRRRDRRRDLTA
jgi:hypothetical protein